MFDSFLIPFIVVGLAEFGDKTQIAILMVAARTSKHWSLLWGILLAFGITNSLAVIMGNFISTLIDLKYIKIITGILFIVFGIYSLRDQKEEKKNTYYKLKNPFLTGFILILLLEMGDKTQLTAGLLATKYHMILVFLGVMSSLSLLSMLAIFSGKMILNKINHKYLTYVSSTIFILIGLLTFIGI